VESALVERLVADAAGEPGILPFVQETLVLLWERLDRRFLPLVAYEALVLPHQANNWDGDKPLTGLQVAMANRADATLADLEDQAIARRLFLRLIQFGEGRPDTRRQLSFSDLCVNDDSQLFDATIEHLTKNRLLTLSGKEEDKKVDIAHKALISGWPRLEEWIKEWRIVELTRRQLEAKVDNWERLNRQGGLLDAVELQEIENWLNNPDLIELGYSKRLLTFVQISRKKVESESAKESELTDLRELIVNLTNKSLSKNIQVFLCHAREDQATVEKIYQQLYEQGLKPWMDKKDILFGERWKPSIKKAIEQSHIVLVFISKKSASKRGFFQKEIRYALEKREEMLDSDNYLIPVRLEKLDDCDIPESFREYQWVDWFEDQADLKSLVDAIHKGIERR